MLQTAVLVDAGYLHAQGSALLAGSAQRRERNRLNVPLVLAALAEEAKVVEPAARLPRIYWYDGVAGGGALNQEQSALSQPDNVKCRFGVINSRGQQKRVDPLIVTDLIQLAREQAFSDAIIMSGDEDVRVGVQLAQTFGIRVHLLGIHPARGSRSPDLMAEADVGASEAAETDPTEGGLDAILGEHIGTMPNAEATTLLACADQNRGQLPADFDRPMLARARNALDRELTPDERRAFREQVRERLRTRAATGAAQ